MLFSVTGSAVLIWKTVFLRDFYVVQPLFRAYSQQSASKMACPCFYRIISVFKHE